MESARAFLWVIPLSMLAIFAWRYLSNGGAVAAVLRSRVVEAIGEITIPVAAGSSKLRVYVMEPNTDGDGRMRPIALAVSSASPLAAELIAISLSTDEVKQLILLLERATLGSITSIAVHD
jgi:hypothetical protein